MSERKFAPVLIALRDGNQFYKYLLIEKGQRNIKSQDESIYVKLWREKLVQVSVNKEVEKVPDQINISSSLIEVFNPYVSYHSESGRIHVNAKNNSGEKIPLIKDKITTKRIDAQNSTLGIPFCSVLFPSNIQYLDVLPPRPANFEYNYLEISDDPIHQAMFGLKKESFVVIDRKKIGNNNALSIEFIMHKKDGYIDKDWFPKNIHDSIIEFVRVDNDLANLSYTIIFRKINEMGETKKIILSIFSSDKPWIIGVEQRLQ